MKENKGKELVQNWINTVEIHNAEEIIKLYSKKAILLGTIAPSPLVGKKEILTYFIDFVKYLPTGKITYDYSQYYKKIIVASGNYDFVLTENGIPKLVPARFTFVFKRKNNKYKITSHHSSENP